MISALRSNNFFTTYIVNPFTNNLGLGGKIAVAVAAVAFAVLSVVVITPIVRFFQNRSVKPLQPASDSSEAHKTPADNTAAKIATVSTLKLSEDISVRAIQYVLSRAESIEKHISKYLIKERIESTTELDLDGIEVTPQQLTQIASTFTNITKLVLTNSNLQDEHLQALAAFKSLEEINLSKKTDDKLHAISLRDEQLAHFTRLTKLTTLYLNGHVELSGKTLGCLPKSIIFLAIQSCSITDESISHLKQIPLKFLLIGFNDQITGSTFQDLPQSLISLSAGSSAIDDTGVANLSHLVNLQSLDLRSNKAITDKNFDKLSPTVNELDLLECDKLTKGLFDKIKHLTNVDLVLPAHLKKE